MADQAWEKMRATGGVQQGLETECSTLRQQLSEAQTQSRSLLTACALLCGAVYPLYARMNALSSQRHLLEEQMVLWDNCRDRARYLVNVLTAELSQVCLYMNLIILHFIHQFFGVYQAVHFLWNCNNINHIHDASLFHAGI